MRLLHGRPLAESINAKTRERVRVLERRKILPRLDVVSVGIDPAASTYQERLARSGKQLGVDVRAIALAPGAVEEEVASKLRSSSADRSVHGILMLTPLSPPLDEARLVEAIAPAKDVEGVHPRSAGLLAAGRPHFIPSTAEGVVELLKFHGVPLRGAQAVVIGRSPVVGRPAASLLLREDATVAIAHSKTSDLPALTRAASVVVVAIGKPGFLTGDMLSPGVTVIDAGINVTPSGITGDVDVESVSPIAAALSPVPGGLGAVTTALLLRNVVTAAEEQNERRVGPPRAANP
jgi:methylenetetrahydrofolate dehydrogenase (NADP+)/methenyltetrahydrofolate cyclohydrolase